MRIEVSAVGSDNVVSFSCSAGVGAGVWCSDDPPLVGRTYDVEVDVEDGHLRSGSVIGFRLDGEHTVVGGVLHVTEDDAAYLDVGGSTVSIELPEAVSGELVEVVADRAAVHLFPYVT